MVSCVRESLDGWSAQCTSNSPDVATFHTGYIQATPGAADQVDAIAIALPKYQQHIKRSKGP